MSQLAEESDLKSLSCGFESHYAHHKENVVDERKSCLSDPVLVLNRNWQVTAVSTVKGSLCSIFSGKARVVDKDYALYNFASWADLEVDDDAPYVKLVKGKIKVPEIIILTTYDRLPTRSLTYSKYHVIKRDHAQCQYCGAHPGKDGITRDDMTIDHVIPKSRGGKTTWRNCVVACLDCNHAKADKTPAEAGMKLTRKPRKPKWSPRQVMVRVGQKDSWEQFTPKE